jgi:hypothetical protein
MTQPATTLNIGDNAAPRIGARMPDGTICAGISANTNQPMYALPADCPLTMSFKQAQKYAQGLNRQKAHGHDGWHVPTGNELNVLFNNRAAIGGFNVGGVGQAGWYWASSPLGVFNGAVKRFSDGYQDDANLGMHYSVRFVR